MENGILLEQDTLIVQDGGTYLVYTPFRGLIARVSQFPEKNSCLYEELLNRGFFQEVPATTKQDQEWRGFQSLTLLLTRACNMGCTYCYAKATPNGEQMPLSVAIGAVTWFLNRLALSTVRVTFHGGGEPTLEIETIKKVVEHVERCRGNKKATYLITTNGTTKREVWDWMMEYRFGISISMDGPPDIQDRNRPLVIVDQQSSSQLVEENLRYLVSKSYPFSIRLTYSAADDMERIIRYFGNLGVKKLHLEPLFPYGRDYSTVQFGNKSPYDIYAPRGPEFLTKFLNAVEVAKEFGIRINNGHLSSFINGRGYFCGAASARSMVVNHEGQLTGCLEVVDSFDPDAKTFNFGYYLPKENRFEIDSKKIKMMQERHADILPECKICYARYTCAGGCAVKAVRESGDFFARDIPYCVFTKGLVPALVKKIAQETKI